MRPGKAIEIGRFDDNEPRWLPGQITEDTSDSDKMLAIREFLMLSRGTRLLVIALSQCAHSSVSGTCLLVSACART